MKKIFSIIILTAILIGSFKFIGDKNSLSKITTNDDYNFISINNILMWQANNGDGSHDPDTDGNGFYWPGGRNATKSAIFEDGFIWGGIIDGDVRVGGNTYRSGLQAGKILENGEADDPNLEKYRVYKIRKGWQSLTLADGFTQNELDTFKVDYDEWPVEDGAPWIDIDGDGVFTRGIDQPRHVGDETLWFVANDFDPARTAFLYGKPPLGLEMQTTIYAFNKPGLEDVVFKKYKIINRGQNLIEDMHFGMWSDFDLGDASDDFYGCDTIVDLMFGWNGDNYDDVYREGAPPALGYQFLQGPRVSSLSDSAFFYDKWNQGYKNFEMTAFFPIIKSSGLYSDPWLGESIGSQQMYYYLAGKTSDGNFIIDPLTGQQTTFGIPGDPVTQSGWHNANWPNASYLSDKRMIGGTGPVQMAPGDTQEVVIAIVIGRGKNNIDSISRIRQLARRIKIRYHNNFEPINPIPQPIVNSAKGTKIITLYWQNNVEDFKENGYSFEGYRILQYKDALGSDPLELVIFDKANKIEIVADYIELNGELLEAFLPRFPNKGLTYHFDITSDGYSGDSLKNGSKYYFEVQAFAYNPDGDPRILTSESNIISIIPGGIRIDVSKFYNADDFIESKQISGSGDGFIGIKVIDSDKLNGHTYKIFFEDTVTIFSQFNIDYDLKYSLVNQTTDDTLINSKLLSTTERYWRSVTPATDTVLIDNGFQFILQNSGFDSLKRNYARNVIKEVVELAGPGDVDLEKPLNVLDSSFNSTGKWFITADNFGASFGSSKADINWDNKAGRARYEIRFTTIEQGSEYYLSGNSGGFLTTAPYRNDPKAANKVPFQIWTLGDDLISEADDYQLIIKVMDTAVENIGIEDSVWTQFPTDDSLRANQWERIFAYLPKDTLYQDVLPDESGLYTTSRLRSHHKIGNIIINGELPEPGTVVQIDTWRPLSELDTFLVTATAPILNDYAGAKQKLDQISVFPNPYFGANPFGRFPNRNYMRFTDLPQKVIVRIFSLSGQLVNKIEKDSDSPWLDWDLRNSDGKAVASGIYIAHLEMPKIGKKIMKLALVQDNN